MNDYLIDRETLGKFVDELIKNKVLPVENAEELDAQRESLIKSLDEEIGVAIFSRLTKEQGAEFDQLLDRGETTENDFEAFFNRANIDIEQITKETAEKFAKKFLGGQNA